ncbi:MAG TPA: PilX N-terminal domain-containing pilus assembly protein [Steroidobacteraceae bacterium]|jgi:type IV pilus assembly protein PilX|nr:PilX N-terminal domain-containing pilus assembly protein [Steroidobacteraceae bacterium]
MNGNSVRKQRGAALIIGLMMLVIVTMLAVSAVNTASTELVMAGNEQFRERAFQAADAGVERAIATLDTVPQTGTAVPINNVAIVSQSGDEYSVSSVFVGYESNVANAGEDFVAAHYRITSTGSSLRNSRAVVDQGAYILTTAGNDGYLEWLEGAGAP